MQRQQLMSVEAILLTYLSGPSGIPRVSIAQIAL